MKRSTRPSGQVIVGLLAIGVGLFLLLQYADNPTSLWMLGSSLFWALLGVISLVTPSHAESTEAQRAQFRKNRWHLPVAFGVFFVGYLPLVLFAPKWAAWTFATVYMWGALLLLAHDTLKVRRARDKE